MIGSQAFIPIENVNKDLVFLKDGSVGMILSVSAVNFALLFEAEQISIIDSFAGLINSLSFPIQIVIYSKIMDVSSYLHTIDTALAKQTNPLLKKMTLSYRAFVEKSIKDNNVLDKQFYICIKITPMEIGLLPSSAEDKIRKVTTLLEPRRDHLIRQLNRLGLKTKQLTTEGIIKLFYEIYNPPVTNATVLPPQNNIKSSPLLKIPTPQIEIQPPKLRPIRTTLAPQPAISIPPPPPSVTTAVPFAQPPANIQLASPFVVEELPDDNGS